MNIPMLSETQELRIPLSHCYPTNTVLDFKQGPSNKIPNRNEIRISALLLSTEDVTHSLCLEGIIPGFLPLGQVLLSVQYTDTTLLQFLRLSSKKAVVNFMSCSESPLGRA